MTHECANMDSLLGGEPPLIAVLLQKALLVRRPFVREGSVKSPKGGAGGLRFVSPFLRPTGVTTVLQFRSIAERTEQ